MKYLFLLSMALLVLTACTSEEDRIWEEIENAKYCERNAECALVQSHCPFDCYQAVHIAEADRIHTLITEFQSTCEYGCVPAEGAACIENKCTVVLEPR